MFPSLSVSASGGKGGDAKSGVEGNQDWSGSLIGGGSSRVFNFGSGSAAATDSAVPSWVWIALVGLAGVGLFLFRK